MATRLRSWIAVIVVAVVMCSCAGAGSPPPDSVAAGKNPAPGSADGEKRADRRDRPTESDESGSTDPALKGADESGGSLDGLDSSEPAASSDVLGGRSIVRDPEGDQTGTFGPGYADLVDATVEDKGSTFLFTASVAEMIPSQLDDSQNMILGIGLEDSSGATFAVIAQGTADGWTSTTQSDDEALPLTKGWSIEGSRISWSVPKNRIELEAVFEWGSSLRFFDFSSGQETGDKVPDSGPKTYPEGG